MSPARERLEQSVGAVRTHLVGRALLAASVWLGAVLALILALAWLLAGSDGWRQGSGTPLALDLVVLAVAVAVVQGIRAGTQRWFGEGPLSEAMEVAAGIRPGLVRGALELNRSMPNGVSAALLGRATDETVAALGHPARDLSGTLGVGVDRWMRRGSGILATLAVVLTLLVLASPQRAGRAWAGLGVPLRVLAAPVYPPLVVTPGTVEVPRGSDVEVRLEAPGRLTAQLSWQAAGDVTTRETLQLTDGVAVKRFPALSATVEYGVATPDGAAAGPYRLVPVDPLFVSDLTVEVAYPPHTGLLPEEYRGTIPPLAVPVGTRLLVEGQASRALAEAALLDSAGTAVLTMTLSDARFDGAWRPVRGGRFAWRFLDDDGAEAAFRPEPIELTLLPDSAPSVSIPVPGRDTILSLSLKQPLIMEARDDYGLRRLELVAYRVTALGETQEPVTQGLDLGGSRAALARPMLDVSQWGLLPGEEVRYFARAVDNAPGAQTSVSREYVLRMPSAGEIRRDAEQQLDDVAQRLEELAAEAERRAEETRDLQREAAANRPDETGRTGRPDREEEMGFAEREELRKALEGQEELTSEVDSLRAELEALQRTMEDAGQADPELRDDLKELQELLKQIAGEDLEKRLEELAEGLEQEDMRKAKQSLQDLAREQENFRDRLEESLERFRRAAVEQDFRATRSEMDELARKEQALADAMKEADRPELRAEQQEALQKEAEELDARMERLQERLEQLGEEAAAREVTKAREQSEQGQQKMQEARERAERNENQEAGEKAQEAAQQMEKAAEQLDEAQQQMAQEQAQAALRALQQAADDALALARRQSELRTQMQGMSREALADMRADEASLLQGVRNLAQNLQESAEGVMSGNPQLTVQVGRAMEALERTIESLGNQRGPTPAPAAAAAQAVDDLNHVALMAMAGAEQMTGQQGEGQSGQETSEQLEQLAQQQGEVANQTGQLTPMQLGAQAMREQLERLAQEQQSVAEDLDQLSQKEGAEEEALGDLSELAAEAQALAEAMARGRLTPEMMQRQERLFHRLLDAGRSLKKEDEDVSEERESTAAGAFERAEVIPLSADQLGALRYRIPDADQLQRLPPAVRQLVIQYFERLNRSGGGGQP